MLVLFTGDIRQLMRAPALDHIRALEDDLRASGEFPAVIGPATALDFAAAQLTIAPDLIGAGTERDAAATAAAAREQARTEGAAAEEQDLAAAAAEA